MSRYTIKIEEIKSNPNLDLTDRIDDFMKKGWGREDAEELALASIKGEYEYYANHYENLPSCAEILGRILDGKILSESELADLFVGNLKVDENISKYNQLSKKVNDNDGITLSDFYELCETACFSKEDTEKIREGFEQSGKIIDSYSNGPSK